MARSINARIHSTWQRLHRLPGGKWLFSRLLGWMVPYSGSIHCYVQELSPGLAVITLQDRRRVRNHLGSVHAIALANLGELTTGLATLVSMPEQTRGILRGLEVSYEKKARGRLTCTAKSELEPPSENIEHRVRAEIRNADDDLVTVVTAVWIVGPERSPSAK